MGQQSLFDRVDAAKRAGVTPTAVAEPEPGLFGGDKVADVGLSDLITGRQPAKAEPSFWSKLIEAAKAVPDVARLMIEEPGATMEGFGQGAMEGARNIAPTASRVGGQMVGGAIGGTLGSVVPGAGTAAGTIAGAGLGGAAGEALAEYLEGRDLNPAQILTQGALSAVPVPGGSKLAQVGKSMVLGGAGEVGTELAEGRTPTLGGVARGTLLGGAFGAVGSLFDRVDAAKAATGADITPPKVDVTPSVTAVTPDVQPVRMPVKHDLNAEMDAVLAGKDVPGVSVAPEGPTTVNASGGGLVGSAEENARNAAMKTEGQRFVIVDRGGNVRPSTVDGGLSIKKGENFGVLQADGSFQVLDNQGGAMAVRPAAVKDSEAFNNIEQTNPVNTPQARAELGIEPTPSSTRIKQVAKALGDPIPSQQPLDVARRAGEKNFIERIPEHLRKGMKDVFDENNGFESQRRGVQTNERTAALARHIRLQAGPTKANPRGTALNAAEGLAAAQHAVTMSDRVSELVKKIADNKAKGIDDQWDLVALAKARAEETILAANYLGARAETGRALQMHKMAVELLKSRDTIALQQAMKNPALRDNLEEFTKKWSTLNTDVERLDFLRASQKMGGWDKAQSYFMANILSGPKTHLRNLIGNTLNNAFETASRFAATGYDAVKNRGNRTIFAGGELTPRAVGSAFGLKQGLADAAFTMRHGYTPKSLATFDVPRPEFTGERFGAAGRAFNYPGRALEASDAVFHSIAYNSELYSRLYAKARGEAGKAGLKGDKMQDFVKDRMAKWALDTPVDVADSAQKAAQRMVFKEDPGKFVQALLNVKEKGGRGGKIAGFIVPFIKTPANIFRQAYEATPAGAIPSLRTSHQREAFAAGGREEAEAAGRMIAGTAALATMALWAAEGNISGSGPKDPEKRAALVAEGWQPNSIKIGGKWVDYTTATPISQPLMAMANAFEKYAETAGEGKPLDTGHAAQIAASMGNSLLDQSFLSGLSDANAAMSDPERFGTQFVTRIAQGFVPFSGLQRNIAQTIDPVQRVPDNPIEGVKSIIPGVSTTVAPKLDRFGAESERPFLSGFNPVGVRSESSDPLVKELKRLKVDSIGLPSKTLSETKTMPGRDLTTEEQQRMGEAVRKALETLTQSPGWQEKDEDVARAQIGRTVSSAREQVIRELRLADYRSGKRK